MSGYVDVKLTRLSAEAQSTANREREPMAVFNLNRAGARLLVIRSAYAFAGEDRMVSGPFEPEADMTCRHCGADLPEGVTPKGSPDCPACGRDN